MLSLCVLICRAVTVNYYLFFFFFFFQAEDGIRDVAVTGVQTCALPISRILPPTDAPPGGADPARDAAGRAQPPGVPAARRRGGPLPVEPSARDPDRHGGRGAGHRQRRRGQTVGKIPGHRGPAGGRLPPGR